MTTIADTCKPSVMLKLGDSFDSNAFNDAARLGTTTWQDEIYENVREDLLYGNARLVDQLT